MKLRIGILGTRGVPNQYGGFEQFASWLSKGLAAKGHEVYVYNPHTHSYREKIWNGVNIVHCYDAGHLGTCGQFVYDFNCVLDARKRNYDILLVLGYTSSSVWSRLYPRKTVVVTNMDGLEWKRSKYSSFVQSFLRYAEKLAVKFSDVHVADSLAIQSYLQKKYLIKASYISYGAELPDATDEAILKKYDLVKDNYFLLIARMEPENNIEVILDGLCKNENNKKVIVVGNVQNKYGRKMVKKFASQTHIYFVGTIYDTLALHTLKNASLLYFHGHSVGGTNPSLLEAMASGALICAHDNEFNRAILAEDAFYFTSPEEVALVSANIRKKEIAAEMIGRNLKKIRENHTWEKIIDEYENLFIKSVKA